MKKAFLYLNIFLFASIATMAQVDRSKRPEAGPAPTPVIGEYESFELKNGLKIFVVENHKLPRVSMSLIFDLDPIKEGEKAGYVEMAGEMMGRGTTSRPKDELNEEVDFMGASLNTSSRSVSMSGLSKYAEKFVEIMADVAMNPAMSQEEFDKAKEQFMSAIESNKDDASAIMGNLWATRMFGKDHPYGEVVTEETLGAVTLEDCKNYHATYIKPNVAYVAIVGDVKAKKVKKYFKKYMGEWGTGEVPSPTYEMPANPGKTSVAFVDRQASVQSVVRIGNPTVLKPGDADVDAIRVMNVILGGGSMGRLYNNLREDKGYTYGAYSTYDTDELVGNFYAYAQVRNAVTDSAVEQFLAELSKMRSGLATDEEIKKAKASIRGSFGRSLEQPGTVASFALNIARYNLPADYYSNYLTRLDAVTAEDIQRVAQKYIAEENLTIAIVGKGVEVAPTLDRFGKINYFDIYGNPTEAPSFLTMPEGVSEEDVVNNYIKAIGGQEKLEALKAYAVTMEAKMQGLPAPMNMVQAKKMPDYYAQIQEIPGMYSAKIIYARGKATQSSPQGSGPIEGEQLESLKAQAAVAFPELEYLTDAYELKLEGQTILNGKQVYQILVKAKDGTETREYYSVESGLKVQEESETETPNGPATVSVIYGDYQEFKGIKFPSKITQSSGPQKIEMTLQEVKIDKEVSMDLFK